MKKMWFFPYCFQATKRIHLLSLLLLVILVLVLTKVNEAQAAPPAWQASSAIAASNGSDVTVTLPAHAANDILLLQVVVRDVNDTITWPAGWAQIATVDRGASARYWWAWKRAASSAETDPLVNKNTITSDTYAAVTTYRGAITTGDPWEVKGTPNTSTVASHVLNGITTLTAESLIVASLCGEDNSANSMTFSATNPASMTQVLYVESSTSLDGACTAGADARTAIGATGNVTATWSSSVVGSGGIVLALKPAPATPPTVTTNAATALTATGATLNGTVSSNGAITTVTFDYGTTIAYGSTATATASPLAATAVNTAVSVAVTGLTCNTTYHFRVKGVNSAGTTNGSDLTFTTSACPPLAACNSGTISGVINTYYPGTASVAAGATSISVGAASGAATGLAQNDLILVMQMQDATIDTTNASSYGTATFINAGKYEYATVASVAGSTVTLTSGLVNSYTTAAYGAAGQKTFQVIRVPVYSSATLGAATAKAWDGSSGGVLAFDVTGALTLAGATADVSGKGFRGGGGCEWIGDNVTGGLSASDYRRNASTTCPSGSQAAGRTNGLKGEGIAGTPRYVYGGSAPVINTGVEGYPNGSTGRGAPANAGGGGTDDDPVNNDENTGGGGGANAGTGGMGGYGWSAPASPGRGIGGAAVSSSAGQLIMGGGGGAATTNNGTNDGNGLNSSGVAGGGIVMVRAGSLTGTGTFNANGEDNIFSVGNDGSGGGGGAGSVLVYAVSGLPGLTVNAKGGIGGSNTGGGVEHGPGGGGGGGYVMTSAAPAACNVSGGVNGTTFSSSAFGATPGSVGSCATTLTSGQIPGAALGAGPCVPALHHYAISYPLGNPGVTCEAMAVRITGHDSTHGAVAPTAGIQITLSTNPASGGWALKTGGGAFTAPNKYTFDGTETFAEFWLTQTTPTTAPHIDIDVADGSKTDVDGDVTEDDKAQFADTAFNYYACTGVVPGTCSAVSINNQIAGKSSSLAPDAQSLYLRAVKKSTTTGACVGGLAGAQNVEFAYECNNPATCYGANLMSINGGINTTITRNNNGAVTSASGSYTPVGMTFDANGYAPFNLNYGDAGQVTLHARKTVTAGVGTPPSAAATIYGASNAFVARPFAFELTVPGNPKASAYNGAIFTSAGSNFDATVRGVVWQAVDDTNNDGLPDSGADLSNNATTPSYAWATSLTADSASGSYTPLPAEGGVLGMLSPSPATIPLAGFSNGQGVYSPLTYSEVGSFTLKANATDYLGVVGLNVGGQVVVGRFIPDHFGLTGTVQTRSDLLPATGSVFTYMDEPMKLALVVTAYTAGDSVTQNYVGNFAKLDAATLGAGGDWFNTGCTGATQCFGLGAVNGVTGLSNRLAIDTSVANPSNLPWASGVGNFTAYVKLNRNATPDGPYLALKFGAMPRDSEGVTLPGAASADSHKVNLDATTGNTLASNPDGTNERKLLFTTDVRFGRLWMGNAYGPEQRDMTIPFEVQYWNGNTFIKNTADSLTSIAKANIGLGNHQPSGFSSSVDLTHVPAGPFPVTSGSGSLTLLKPSSSPLSGSVDVVFDLGTTTTTNTSWVPSQPPTAGANMGYLRGKWSGAAYDRDPTSRGTFGIFGSSLKKGPIYLRENY